MFIVTWDGEKRYANSLYEVDELLDLLHEEFRRTEPYMISVEFDGTGDCLSIGLGRDVSVLTYVSGTLDPPYLASRGQSKQAGFLTFRFAGEVSELPMKCGIPVSVAREAIRYFCRNGQLTSNVEWAQD